MKSFTLFAAALALGLSLTISDAEAAKRFGGGKSSGMQRDTVTQRSATPNTPASPNQTAAPMQQPGAAAAAGQAAQPKRSWMGPVAGLAAGLGLAALASHLGFGEELASMLMIGLLVLAVLMVVGFFLRKKAAAQQPALAGAGAGGMSYSGQAQDFNRQAPAATQAFQAEPAATGSQTVGAALGAATIPAGFDAEGFVRSAKVNFIRLQAANDAGNLEDIREFTTPEMFAEIKMDFVERGDAAQQTDVVSLEAEVVEVLEEASRYLVSVRFHGLIRENAEAAAEAFDEIWHLSKPVDGSRGWLVAGIQQAQ